MSSEQAQESLVVERSLDETAEADARSQSVEAGLREAGSNEVLSGSPPLLVFKFGGTSLAGTESMLHSAALVRDECRNARLAVVVSAMRGVTDRLLSIAHSLRDGALPLARTEAEFLRQLHREVLRELRLPPDEHLQFDRELSLLGRDLLHEVPRQGEKKVDGEVFDRLAGFGERFSARLFAGALTKLGIPAVPVASSDFVVTNEDFRNAKPDLPASRSNGRAILQPLLRAGIVPVVTGFIGATGDGRVTTLGRNSSDYSGAIIAHCVDARELVIWTDVDGIYTANPKDGEGARLLHDLTYDQAHALTANGAKVLHADVLPLAAKTRMVVWVRNTFKPQLRGTRIGASAPQGAA